MRSIFIWLRVPGSLPTRRTGWSLSVTRWMSGLVFLAFGAGKFVNHAAETHSFRAYGLPSPALVTGAIGVLELACGALLIAGRATRLAALLLAGDMIAAIVLSGILRGETVSITLAPALLAAMVVLVAFGPGRRLLDRPMVRGSRNCATAARSEPCESGSASLDPGDHRPNSAGR